MLGCSGKVTKSMAIKKSDLYSLLWVSCEASQTLRVLSFIHELSIESGFERTSSKLLSK